MIDRVVEELHRLEGRSEALRPRGIATVPFFFDTAAAPANVLQRARDVLTTLDRRAQDRWLTDEEWKLNLPQWFVSACDPEMTAEQQSDYLAQWRSMSDEARQVAEATQRWALADWLYWMDPERRAWWWWSAEPATRSVVVEIDESPVPFGALRWLLRACGASRVREGEPGA